MIYLGLHNNLEAGAALIIDGKLIGAVHEERFVREKGFKGWPQNSINYLLKLAGIDIRQVDKIVFGMFDGVVPDEAILPVYVRRLIQGVTENPSMLIKHQERVESEIAFNKRKLAELMEELKKLGVEDKICFMDHHLSHAASAYYCSPFDECFVFTCDGKGSFQSYGAWWGSSEGLKRLDIGTTFDSAGYFYGTITKATGFKPERHEGKITGLAAKGDFSKFKHITDQMLKLRDGKIYGNLGDYYLPWFCDNTALPKLYEAVSKFSREDIAAAAQKTLEEVVCGWVESILTKHNASGANVALAGGVFANVKLNQRIRELRKVKNIYIHPAMGDGGIPLGGVLAEMHKDGTPYKKFLTNAFLGCEFSEEEIKSTLQNHDLKFTIIEDMPSTLIKLFEKKKPVGFFRGRMEYGPRALCNRSIFYHAKDPTINDWLNKMLNRSEFMPFAPVTIEEIAPRCFIGWHVNDHSADFMTMTYDCTDEFKEKCPAAVHVDGTARPQIVRESVDPEMHAIIKKYHEMTGDLAFLNTSFNNHEEPIVCTVEDAINSFNRGNVDALILGKFLVER